MKLRKIINKLLMNYLTEPLNRNHNRKIFQCGEFLLDNYFQYQVSQDIKRKLTACFVLNDNKQNSVKAYYTLSNNAIPQTRIPSFFQKKLPPSYSYLPATLLGRLAVDIKFQNKGLGKLILIDALKKIFGHIKNYGFICCNSRSFK